MKLVINENGVWYHGSNIMFDTLREGSTITQWKALAEAFSHKPSCLSYDDDGSIEHNGTEDGFLYIIDEDIKIGVVVGGLIATLYCARVHPVICRGKIDFLTHRA